MTQAGTVSKIKQSGIWHFALMLFLSLFFAFPAVAQQIPGCNTTMEDILDKLPDIPQIDDLQKGLELGTKLLDMSDDDIFDHLEELNPLLDNLDPDQMTTQLKTLDQRLQNPSLEVIGILGGSIKTIMGENLSQYDAKLRKMHEALGEKMQQEPDPAKRQQHQERMNKIADLIGEWEGVIEGVEKSQTDLNKWLEEKEVMKHVGEAKKVLDIAADPASIGSEITELLKQVKWVEDNMAELNQAKSVMDGICGLMADGVTADGLIDVMDSLSDGALTEALEDLKQWAKEILAGLIDKLADGVVKDAAQDALDSLENGDLDGAVDSLKDSGVDAALDQLGGVTGLFGGGNGVGTNTGTGGFNPSTSIGSALNTAANSLGVGPGYGPLCKQKRRNETYKCPQVECDSNVAVKGIQIPNTSQKFVDRVKAYFEYKPEADNRAVLLDKGLHDYEINVPSERTRAPTYRMDQPSNGCNSITSGLGLGGPDPDSKVNEACQDNRWRDTCLIGPKRRDHDFALTGRKLMGDEEPLPGVAGSVPVYNKAPHDLNCLVPKNTERLSPLELDNGWRHRDMCPGNQKLVRVERDQLTEHMDIFRGKYGCFAPLPKCGLKNDWQLDSIQWKNRQYGTYISKFGDGILNNIGNILGLTDTKIAARLKGLLSSDQFDKVKKLMNPQQSAAAECKPAFWVRLMLDSCANQYILQKSMKPSYIHNPDSNIEPGASPRYCQPFKPKLIPFGQEEYKVSDYLKRSYKGLLKEDYMPWVAYDRQEGDFAKEGRDYRRQNWPPRKIKWKNNTWSNTTDTEFKSGFGDIKSSVDINDYAKHPVERIVDPLHPFSPRYDIAELVDGTLLTDRNLFGKATESEAKITWAKILGLEKYWCVPKSKKGYWEFDCTIYCSAVNVDLLRFRYKDYNLCMGCQIDTNERAFWEEYETNRKYYKDEYCDKWFSIDDDCEYGDTDDKEVCSSCGYAAKYYTYYAASCAVTLGYGCNNDYLQKAIKYTALCEACKQGAKAEALDRTRSRTNKKEEPEWGPTAMGNKWPVCSTRFDHRGDPSKCKEAKEEYTCEAMGEAAEDDPNIAKESKDDAEQCEKKTLSQICHGAAKPVYSVNFLKIRTRKGDFRTDDTDPDDNWGYGNGKPGASSMGGDFDKKVEDWRNNYADEDPAEGYGFREYFGNHRPYMRWWDTGKESFQAGMRPDYWCDWGQNDAIMGVGRDYNSIHGRKAQLCRYGGGGGIGDNCFSMQEWKEGTGVPNDRRFPSLAGSEWAELKMYQANCFRQSGLNCLCQYEKVFKHRGSEDHVLAKMGALLTFNPTKEQGANVSDDEVSEFVSAELPMNWRGYVSTPKNRDTNETSPAISTNQQFPYLFGSPSSGSIISGGLDKARPGDIAIWPAGTGTLPYTAIVEGTNNIADYGSLDKVPGSGRWVRIIDTNNGKYPDACGNTSLLGRGSERTLYPNKDEMPEPMQKLVAEQVTATYYCDDPELAHCVDRNWSSVVIYRPRIDDDREGKR